MRSCFFPFRKPAGVLIPVATRVGFGIDAHGDADFGKVAEEIEMPVDHGHLEAIREAVAGSFADLVTQSILHRGEHDHHDRGQDNHGIRESPFFNG